MNDLLYMRETEAQLADKSFHGNDFTIGFDVPFDDENESNVAELKIYNLSDATVAALKKDSPAVLIAGYQSAAGAILTGTIKHAASHWQGVDKITTVEVVDNNDAWLNTPVKKTYKEGTTAKEILSDLLPLTRLEISAFSLPKVQTYPRGKTLNTTLGNAIKALAKDCDAKMHVNRGRIFLRPAKEGDSVGIVIDADHGLIGSPERIEEEHTEVKSNKKVNVTGWKVKTLLNPLITTDVVLQITSKTANGVFRVKSGKHAGQSDGGAYYTEVEVFPV